MRAGRVAWLSASALLLLILFFVAREELRTRARWRAAENAAPLDTIIDGSYLLVGSQASASLTVIEAATGRIVGAIPVPEGPHELAVSPDSRFVVATLAGDAGSWRPPWRTMKTVAVIDLTAMRQLRNVDLGPHGSPHGVVFIDERTAAVTSATSQSIVFIDCLDATILGAVDTSEGRPSSNPHMLAISEDRRRIYSANIDSNTVSEIDTKSRAVLRHVSFPGKPVAVAAASDNTIWVIQEQGGETYRVAVADLRTGRMVAHFTDLTMPRRIAMVPDHTAVLVTDLARNEVQVYDAAKRTLKSRIPLEPKSNPSGISFVPGSNSAFIALGAGQVAEVDYRSGIVVRTIATPGQHPDGIVLVPRPR